MNIIAAVLRKDVFAKILEARGWPADSPQLAPAKPPEQLGIDFPEHDAA